MLSLPPICPCLTCGSRNLLTPPNGVATQPENAATQQAHRARLGHIAGAVVDIAAGEPIESVGSTLWANFVDPSREPESAEVSRKPRVGQSAVGINRVVVREINHAVRD